MLGQEEQAQVPYFFFPLAPRLAFRSRFTRSSSNFAMRAASASANTLRCSDSVTSSFFVAAQMAGSAPDASPDACTTTQAQEHTHSTHMFKSVHTGRSVHQETGKERERGMERPGVV